MAELIAHRTSQQPALAAEAARAPLHERARVRPIGAAGGVRVADAAPTLRGAAAVGGAIAIVDSITGISAGGAGTGAANGSGPVGLTVAAIDVVGGGT